MLLRDEYTNGTKIISQKTLKKRRFENKTSCSSSTVVSSLKWFYDSVTALFHKVLLMWVEEKGSHGTDWALSGCLRGSSDQGRWRLPRNPFVSSSPMALLPSACASFWGCSMGRKKRVVLIRLCWNYVKKYKEYLTFFLCIKYIFMKNTLVQSRRKNYVKLGNLQATLIFS